MIETLPAPCRARWIAVAGAALLLAGCTTTPGAEHRGGGASPGAEAASGAETVATGLDAPWSIAFHGETPLVSERDTARIVELDAEGGSREVAVIDGVVPAGEGGLLGIAVHDEHLYVNFTARDENRIERLPLAGEPGALALGEAETILDGIPAASHHNGGRIAIGPDGMLYATTGDAGDPASAQDAGSLAGKILRLAPDGAAPADNPFPGSYVYSLGHRNAQGLAWDDDGALYASEFGQNTWDELNVIEAGGNYGWPEVEGIAGRAGFVDPVQQWEPGEASPSGMAVVDGSLYIANLRGERLREVPLGDLGASTEHLAGVYGRLREAAVAPDGSLWVLTNSTDGRGAPADGDDRILRVDPR
ncbi:PQQ-dependent sugar dehydrogenase [Leucobacter muris]|uniref:PQQ-dependent sugar dehydrogenase n=1 Tax=Leucobacter muris TaxID=1935379 RepID=A0ABX5QG40_9MICO|nr:PQQ-dependent sugar dehydrogenase [Leucobacter muris]QAB17973.1 PQQ-dependent sugar dehydrogenase [Leucobacter muris]